MASIRDIAVEYGQRVEGLLERLGAGGQVKGAGELLDQVKDLIDPEGLRRVRLFLKLRNKVIHNKPPEMPMPSRKEVVRAGREAVEVLEGTLRRLSPETPGPVYRLRDQDGAYEIWVGPAGVWVVAGEREPYTAARARLVTRFPRLPVKVARRADGLEARVRWGRARLSPEEVLEVVRLLSRRDDPHAAPWRGAGRAEPVHHGDDPLRDGRDNPRPAAKKASPSAKARDAHRMREVRISDIPATFYVGPVGVLVVAEHPRLAELEARRVREDSGGAIAALPVVLAPGLQEPQGRIDGVLALRDDGAIREYLRGRRALDNDEVDQVAGWLRNRRAPVPAIRPKEGRYRLKGKEVVEGSGRLPPFGPSASPVTGLRVELIPPGPPPRPGLARLAWRAVGWVGWRVAFLPELALLVTGATSEPRSVWAWVLLAVLGLRFFALYGPPQGWKRRVLVGVGALEVLFGIAVIATNAFLSTRPTLKFDEVLWMVVIFLLVPGIISLLRAQGFSPKRQGIPWRPLRSRVR